MDSIIISLYSLHPFGIGDSDTDGIFQKIRGYSPIFSILFHTDIKAIVIN